MRNNKPIWTQAERNGLGLHGDWEDTTSHCLLPLEMNEPGLLMRKTLEQWLLEDASDQQWADFFARQEWKPVLLEDIRELGISIEQEKSMGSLRIRDLFAQPLDVFHIAKEGVQGGIWQSKETADTVVIYAPERYRAISIFRLYGMGILFWQQDNAMWGESLWPAVGGISDPLLLDMAPVEAWFHALETNRQDPWLCSYMERLLALGNPYETVVAAGCYGRLRRQTNEEKTHTLRLLLGGEYNPDTDDPYRRWVHTLTTKQLEYLQQLAYEQIDFLHTQMDDILEKLGYFPAQVWSEGDTNEYAPEIAEEEPVVDNAILFGAEEPSSQHSSDQQEIWEWLCCELFRQRDELESVCCALLERGYFDSLETKISLLDRKGQRMMMLLPRWPSGSDEELLSRVLTHQPLAWWAQAIHKPWWAQAVHKPIIPPVRESKPPSTSTSSGTISFPEVSTGVISYSPEFFSFMRGSFFQPHALEGATGKRSARGQGYLLLLCEEGVQIWFEPAEIGKLFTYTHQNSTHQEIIRENPMLIPWKGTDTLNLEAIVKSLVLSLPEGSQQPAFHTFFSNPATASELLLALIRDGNLEEDDIESLGMMLRWARNLPSSESLQPDMAVYLQPMVFALYQFLQENPAWRSEVYASARLELSAVESAIFVNNAKEIPILAVGQETVCVKGLLIELPEGERSFSWCGSSDVDRALQIIQEQTKISHFVVFDRSLTGQSFMLPVAARLLLPDQQFERFFFTGKIAEDGSISERIGHLQSKKRFASTQGKSLICGEDFDSIQELDYYLGKLPVDVPFVQLAGKASNELQKNFAVIEGVIQKRVHCFRFQKLKKLFNLTEEDCSLYQETYLLEQPNVWLEHLRMFRTKYNMLEEKMGKPLILHVANSNAALALGMGAIVSPHHQQPLQIHQYQGNGWYTYELKTGLIAQCSLSQLDKLSCKILLRDGNDHDIEQPEMSANLIPPRVANECVCVFNFVPNDIVPAVRKYWQKMLCNVPVALEIYLSREARGYLNVEEDWSDYAGQIYSLLQTFRSRWQIQRYHLFFGLPSSIAFMLGRHLNVLFPASVYVFTRQTGEPYVKIFDLGDLKP